jgi:hypothetical protein
MSPRAKTHARVLVLQALADELERQARDEKLPELGNTDTARSLADGYRLGKKAAAAHARAWAACGGAKPRQTPDERG